ncbi:hypothetical protein FISHEDRAFT_55587 [Fistulina hepatica ATCC 64428]|uniref:C3H1-type domain-containing protein n=1 Tax=Fistulina hepatica ATCC 64428 TaxID=1128425 RepID=A0A0D7ANP6_9AGAR|nr:hypothetical protein FISHEDRAFT_55587 [Fistulina hepatica ATCC 64428]
MDATVTRENCIFFTTKNGCKKGADCPFSHEKSDSDKLDIPCKFYYQSGACKYGAKCHFAHTLKAPSLSIDTANGHAATESFRSATSPESHSTLVNPSPSMRSSVASPHSKPSPAKRGIYVFLRTDNAAASSGLPPISGNNQAFYYQYPSFSHPNILPLGYGPSFISPSYVLEPRHASQGPPPMPICGFLYQGQHCALGSTCPFRHPDPNVPLCGYLVEGRRCELPDCPFRHWQVIRREPTLPISGQLQTFESRVRPGEPTRLPAAPYLSNETVHRETYPASASPAQQPNRLAARALSRDIAQYSVSSPLQHDMSRGSQSRPTHPAENDSSLRVDLADWNRSQSNIDSSHKEIDDGTRSELKEDVYDAPASASHWPDQGAPSSHEEEQGGWNVPASDTWWGKPKKEEDIDESNRGGWTEEEVTSRVMKTESHLRTNPRANSRQRALRHQELGCVGSMAPLRGVITGTLANIDTTDHQRTFWADPHQRLVPSWLRWPSTSVRGRSRTSGYVTPVTSPELNEGVNTAKGVEPLDYPHEPIGNWADEVEAGFLPAQREVESASDHTDGSEEQPSSIRSESNEPEDLQHAADNMERSPGPCSSIGGGLEETAAVEVLRRNWLFEHPDNHDILSCHARFGAGASVESLTTELESETILVSGLSHGTEMDDVLRITKGCEHVRRVEDESNNSLLTFSDPLAAKFAVMRLREKLPGILVQAQTPAFVRAPEMVPTESASHAVWLSWLAPSRTAWVYSKSITDSKQSVISLSGWTNKGRTPKVERQRCRPRDEYSVISIDNLHIETTEADIAKYCSSVQKIILNEPSYSGSPIDKIRAQLEECGQVLDLTALPDDGSDDMTAVATFASFEGALTAIKVLHKAQLDCIQGKILLRPTFAHNLGLPCMPTWIVESLVKEATEHDTSNECRVICNDGSIARIFILGQSAEATLRLRESLECSLRGKTFIRSGKPAWHPYFVSSSGESTLSKLNDSLGSVPTPCHIRVDAENECLQLYGDYKRAEKTLTRIIDQIESPVITHLDDTSYAFFARKDGLRSLLRRLDLKNESSVLFDPFSRSLVVYAGNSASEIKETLPVLVADTTSATEEVVTTSICRVRNEEGKECGCLLPLQVIAECDTFSDEERRVLAERSISLFVKTHGELFFCPILTCRCILPTMDEGVIVRLVDMTDLKLIPLRILGAEHVHT